MITINNIYNIGDTVFYVKEDKIKSGEIVGIIYTKTGIHYILDYFNYNYYYKKLGTTPEQALENYMEYYKAKEEAKVNFQYNNLKEKIFNNWCKEEEVKLIKTL